MKTAQLRGEYVERAAVERGRTPRWTAGDGANVLASPAGCSSVLPHLTGTTSRRSTGGARGAGPLADGPTPTERGPPPSAETGTTVTPRNFACGVDDDETGGAVRT